MSAPTSETYHAMLSAYRDIASPDHQSVAVRCGVPTRVAKLAWDKGWPNQGLMAIRDTFEAERIRASAERQSLMEENRLRNMDVLRAASTDAAHARALEAVMVRDASTAAATLMGVARDMAVRAAPLAQSILRDIDELVADPSTGRLGEKKAALASVTNYVNSTMALAKQAIDMETVVIGRGQEKPPEKPMAPDDAFSKLVSTLLLLNDNRAPRMIEVEVTDARTAMPVPSPEGDPAPTA